MHANPTQDNHCWDIIFLAQVFWPPKWELKSKPTGQPSTCLVSCVLVEVLLELWVLVKARISWQPHQIVVVHGLLIVSVVA